MEIELFGDEEAAKDRQFVTALARGLEILRCFRAGERHLGNAELAKRTGLPKPTVSRLTHTLTRLGYLNYSEDLGRYELGAGVLSLGYALLANQGVRHVARPFMQELAEHTQAAVALGARDRLSMVYVENCRSSAPLTLRLDVGSRIPLGKTAMGRALLCGLPQRERDYVMDHLRLRDEESWPQVKAGIERGMREYQERGFCMAAGEWKQEVNAVGAPLLTPQGDVMAVTCGGPAFLLPPEKLTTDVGPRLVEMIAAVQAALGRG